jgi:hypothetical protein
LFFFKEFVMCRKVPHDQLPPTCRSCALRIDEKENPWVVIFLCRREGREAIVTLGPIHHQCLGHAGILRGLCRLNEARLRQLTAEFGKHVSLASALSEFRDYPLHDKGQLIRLSRRERLQPLLQPAHPYRHVA